MMILNVAPVALAALVNTTTPTESTNPFISKARYITTRSSRCLGPFLPIHQLGGSCWNATHSSPTANAWPNIRNRHACVFNHLVAAARVRFLPRSPIREETSRTGTHSIFFGRAAGFVRLRLPSFSRTTAIETCSTSSAAA